MEISIVPVAESISPLTEVERAERGGLGGHMRHRADAQIVVEATTGEAPLRVPLSHEPSLQEAIEPVQSELVTLEDIFAKFLQLEVGDGAASEDTIRNYLSQTKQYLNWCGDNLLAPIEAEPEDIKLCRQYLVQSEYANSTISTKLNIVRIFYSAVRASGIIVTNPAAKVKAPKDRKDPAARITFMEAEELKFLLDYIQSQLDKAKTNKQRLVLLRDRALFGTMSLEGCRTVEMHSLTVSEHSLRHTAGTLALRTGSDLRQVQDLLGHADPRTTSIYAHIGDRWEHNPGANVEKELKTKNEAD